MKVSSIKNIYLVIIGLWLCLSVLSVFYNTLKIPSELKAWGGLSDSEKRQKLFGELYDFFIFIDSHTEEKSKILIYSQDVRTFYLGNYYLYPLFVTSIDDKKEFMFQVNKKTFPYVAVYNNEFPLENYEQIATFSARNGDSKGVLYKRK